jgi:hypothetical protein
VVTFCAVRIFAEQKLSAREAAQHEGEQATICGVVVSAHYAARSKGRLTFLDFDQPYPNAAFTVLIWGEDRPKFGAPEVRLRDQRVCATGLTRMYRGTAEMIAREPSQLRAQ